MERTTIEDAKKIMGDNFIGVDELNSISDKFSVSIPKILPEIPFNTEELIEKKKDYFLLLGVSEFLNGTPINLINLRSLFGINPELSEPCFYNQDWYLKEEFINKVLETKWYLIRKKIIDDSRAVQPTILDKQYIFPSSILLAYSFFVSWFAKNEILWKNDFVWCSDFDNLGDRIYVGRYFDDKGLGKNGFSIHRHLSIRTNYGTI